MHSKLHRLFAQSSIPSYLSYSGTFVQEDWEILDFSEIEESLASKLLTDGAICGVLMTIDVINNAKKDDTDQVYQYHWLGLGTVEKLCRFGTY